MSRSIKIAKAGGPEVLQFVEIEVPPPGPNEVRLTVKVIGQNRAESMWHKDESIEPVKFPAGPGSKPPEWSMPDISFACGFGCLR